MIYTHLDRLGPAHQYPKVIYDLLLDLQAQDLTQLELGSHDYGNQGIKLNVFEVQSQDNPDPNRMSECHRDHVDVQVSLAGHEVYGFAPYQEDNQLLEDRLETEDALLFTGLAGEVTLPAQARAVFIFFPNDVHRASYHNPSQPTGRRLVAKVPVTLL